MRSVAVRSLPFTTGRAQLRIASLSLRRCHVVAGCNTRTTLANLASHEQGCSDAAEQVLLLEGVASVRAEALKSTYAELRATLHALEPVAFPLTNNDTPTWPVRTATASRTFVSRLLRRASGARKVTTVISAPSGSHAARASQVVHLPSVGFAGQMAIIQH